jgi:hypothetical protein
MPMDGRPEGPRIREGIGLGAKGIILMGILGGLAVSGYSFLWLGMAVGVGFGDNGCPIRYPLVNSFVSHFYLLGGLTLTVGIPILVLAMLQIPKGHRTWARLLWTGLILYIGGVGLTAYMDISMGSSEYEGCVSALRDTYIPTGGMIVGIVILVLTARFASQAGSKPS